MLRRDFIRAIMSVSIAPRSLLAQQAAAPMPPPAPVPWTLGLNPKTPLPHMDVVDGIAGTEGHFFTPLQMAAFARLCDILLPPIGKKPGALQAGTPLFLDFLIGASPINRQKVYTEGLEWLQSESQKTYKRGFEALDDIQADAMLKPWLRTWMNDHPPIESHADFINIAHDDIRNATVNSKIWSEVASRGAEPSTAAGLYWFPIDPGVRATNAECTPVRVVAAPNAAHSIPAYPR